MSAPYASFGICPLPLLGAWLFHSPPLRLGVVVVVVGAHFSL